MENNRDSKAEQAVNENSNRSVGEGTPIYLTSDSTLQSPEEHTHDKQVDPRSDRTMEASSDDLHEINAGKLTGRDGTNDNNQ